MGKNQARKQPSKIRRVADVEQVALEEAEIKPSRIKQEEVLHAFPFVFRQKLEDGLRINKFTISFPEDVLVAFTVHGPLLALERAFETFQADDPSESKYLGIFQQILPTFSLIGGNMMRKVQQVVPDEANATDGFMLSPEVWKFHPQEKIEQGKPDFLVRVITKEILDQIRARYRKVVWAQLDERQLSETAFYLAEDSQLRIDCIIDTKTDSVSAWNVKTRPQLISSGHQAALQNLQRGFAPRPIYLLAIDRDAFRYCIFDPCGVVTLRASSKEQSNKQKVGEGDVKVFGDYELSGLVQFRQQVALRSKWLRSKADGAALDDEVTTSEDYLEQRLSYVNTQLVSEGKQRVAYGSYVVGHVWEEFPRTAFHAWNGRGLTNSLLPGSLQLCQGLSKVLAGDNALLGCTREGLISAFRLRREREHVKCVEFEQSYYNSVSSVSSILFSKYQEEIRLLSRRKLDLIHRGRGSSVYRESFVDAISQAKSYLRELAAKTDGWDQFLKVVRAYGGEFKQLLSISFSSWHNSRPSDISLSVHCAEALVDKVLICKEVTVPVVSASEQLVRSPCCFYLGRPFFLVYNGPESFDTRCLLECLYEQNRALIIVGTRMNPGKMAALQECDVRFFLCEDPQILEQVALCTSTEVVSDMDKLPKQFGSALEMVVSERGMTLYCDCMAKDEGKVAMQLQIGGPNFLARRESAEAAVKAIESAATKGILPSTAFRMVSDRLACKGENLEVDEGVLAVKDMLAGWDEIDMFHLWEPVDAMLTSVPKLM